MQTEDTTVKPWWKFGYVWLIISGPLIVIIAAMITVYLAITRPDPAIDDYYRKGLEINKVLDAQNKNLAPAMRGRNHAATPAKPTSDGEISTPVH